ncbi:hypothetical protein AKO1_012656, partial [Acrasis kona]
MSQDPDINQKRFITSYILPKAKEELRKVIVDNGGTLITNDDDSEEIDVDYIITGRDKKTVETTSVYKKLKNKNSVTIQKPDWVLNKRRKLNRNSSELDQDFPCSKDNSEKLDLVLTSTPERNAIFNDFGTPPINSMEIPDRTIQLAKISGDGNLHFVNRKERAIYVARQMLNNRYRDKSNQRVIRICQTFGSGKTTFASNFKSIIPQEFWNESNGEKDLLNAEYIHVDFRSFTPDKNDTIGKATYHHIIKTLELRNEIVEGRLIEHLKASQKNYVICFDELEAVNNSHFFRELYELNGEEDRFKRNENVLEVVQSFCGIKNIFVLILSKTPLGKKILAEPRMTSGVSSLLEGSVYLNSLRAIHIDEIMRKTNVIVGDGKNLSVLSFFQIHRKLKYTLYYLEKVIFYTAGCPRMIALYIDYVLYNHLSLNDKENQEKSLRSAIGIMKKKDIVPEFPNVEFEKLYNGLLIAAAL